MRNVQMTARYLTLFNTLEKGELLYFGEVTFVVVPLVLL